jgi:hypothetical protein
MSLTPVLADAGASAGADESSPSLVTSVSGEVVVLAVVLTTVTAVPAAVPTAVTTAVPGGTRTGTASGCEGRVQGPSPVSLYSTPWVPSVTCEWNEEHHYLREASRKQLHVDILKATALPPDQVPALT